MRFAIRTAGQVALTIMMIHVVMKILTSFGVSGRQACTVIKRGLVSWVLTGSMVASARTREANSTEGTMAVRSLVNEALCRMRKVTLAIASSTALISSGNKCGQTKICSIAQINALRRKRRRLRSQVRPPLRPHTSLPQFHQITTLFPIVGELFRFCLGFSSWETWSDQDSSCDLVVSELPK